MKKSFTLIELMIVIAILAILAALISGNFITSLKKGRDAKRKSDFEQIKNALEMFYEDKKHYPSSLQFGGKLCENTCASGEKVYMQLVPKDPLTTGNYQYQSDANGTYFRLFSCIENVNDTSSNVSQTGYSGGPANCGTGVCAICKYTVSSTNIAPLPTLVP